MLISKVRLPRVSGLLVLAVFVIAVLAASLAGAAQVTLPGDSFDNMAQGKVVIRALWGKGADQIGLLKEPDCGPQGAMSFTVGKDGSIYILDQINERVQKYDAQGKIVGSTPIGTSLADTIAVADTGEVYVMDSILTRKIWLAGADRANSVNSWSLPSVTGLAQATDLTVVDGVVWIEGGHTKRYPVISNGKTLSAESVLMGAVDGRKGSADIASVTAVKKGTGRVTLGVEGKSALEGSIDLDVVSERDILSVETLATDAAGRIYLGLLLYKEGPEPTFDLLGSCFSVACIKADGTLIGLVDTPEKTYTENRRRLVVAQDGTIYQMQTDSAGLQVVAYTIPSGGQAR